MKLFGINEKSILLTSVTKKSFEVLINISSQCQIFFKKCNAEFSALLHFRTPSPFFIDDSGAEFHAD